ncbi:GIY-YIG nuclease family protein [Kaarinaea lacus]
MQSQKGTYALVLVSRSQKNIRIGRCGVLPLKPGYYVYVGSAFGPGGLKARLNHHLKQSTSPRWHLDYLRRHTRVAEVWYTFDEVRRESAWVQIMTNSQQIQIPLQGFGASDSNEAAHLFYLETKPKFEKFQHAVCQQYKDHAPVFKDSP